MHSKPLVLSPPPPFGWTAETVPPWGPRPRRRRRCSTAAPPPSRDFFCLRPGRFRTRGRETESITSADEETIHAVQFVAQNRQHVRVYTTTLEGETSRYVLVSSEAPEACEGALTQPYRRRGAPVTSSTGGRLFSFSVSPAPTIGASVKITSRFLPNQYLVAVQPTRWVEG